MKQVNGNKAVILGMAQNCEIEIGERVFSIVNNCIYEIFKENEWVGVREIKQ